MLAAYTYHSDGRVESRTIAIIIRIDFRYDAEGLRAEMEENGQLVKFLFNEEREVVAEETDDEVIRYIRGLGIISSDSESARTYYHYVSDNQGSVRLILTDTVNDRRIRNYYYYDAFGESVISHEDIHNRFRFNGEQYDPIISQYYLGRLRTYWTTLIFSSCSPRPRATEPSSQNSSAFPNTSFPASPTAIPARASCSMGM